MIKSKTPNLLAHHWQLYNSCTVLCHGRCCNHDWVQQCCAWIQVPLEQSASGDVSLKLAKLSTVMNKLLEIDAMTRHVRQNEDSWKEPTLHRYTHGDREGY